jgi:hypothetical protein
VQGAHQNRALDCPTRDGAPDVAAMMRLSPPTLREHDSASTHHDKNDDDSKRFHRRQGLVPVVPKLKHALASIESAPTTDKIHPV